MDESVTPTVAEFCERIIHAIRAAHFQHTPEKPKLSAWFGHEAWMEFRHSLTLMALDMTGSRDFNSLTYYGCDMKLDPDQPLHEVTFMSNGAPVRRLDTKAKSLDTIMSAPHVMAQQLRAMASMFKNGPVVAELPWAIISLKNNNAAKPDDPIAMRHFSVDDWIEWGMVYRSAPRTYSLTLAGKNAVEQFKSFA